MLIKSYVEYFDHQTGASHAIHGSKQKKKCQKEKNTQKLLDATPKTLTDTKSWSTPGKKIYFEFLEYFDDIK